MIQKPITITLERNHLRLAIGVVITAVIIGSAFFVRAAFVEPTAGPASSDQDFAQNILGANSADNAFDSSAVTENADGSIIERLEYFTEYMAERDRNDYTYGRGWIASNTGDNATTSLTHKTCEEADGWVWFEDANGDGDTIDPEDGLCVATSTVTSSNWGGTETADNSYIAAYTCAGAFPNGYVASGGSAAEGCALCVADCYDGRKDLPDNGGYTADASATGYYGPITPEVLKNWKGTRLPTFKDFFGYCGTPSGAADDASGDSYYYSSGATSDKALGYYGQNVGRGANGAPYDEYINLSRTSYEWLSGRVHRYYARVAGSFACSYSYYGSVNGDYRFRAVFRP
jgi:hypothetical protein